VTGVSSSDHTTALVVVAVVAVVAVLLAVAAGIYTLVRTQRDATRISELQAEVRTLCGRSVVTHVTVARTGRFTVQTARGC
jgi:EamA domain-containing membrane protein RarD